MSQNPPPESLPRAGLLRRLAALFYDALLLAAVLMIASALSLPFTGGEAVRAGNPFFSTYILLVAFFFFAWFWTHGGQTLGMRAWRLRLQQLNGSGVSWWHALLRFLSALPAWLLFGLGATKATLGDSAELAGPFGLVYQLPHWLLLGGGIVLLLWDHSPYSWRDRFSETTVVRLPKQPR